MVAGFLRKSKLALPKSCLIQQLSPIVTSMGCCYRSRAQSKQVLQVYRAQACLPSDMWLGDFGGNSGIYTSYKPRWRFLLRIYLVLSSCKNSVSAATCRMAPQSSSIFAHWCDKYLQRAAHSSQERKWKIRHRKSSRWQLGFHSRVCAPCPK